MEEREVRAGVRPLMDYAVQAFDFAAFVPGARVLDLGCGSGEQLIDLASVPCAPIGADVDLTCLLESRQKGFPVFCAEAERLPLADATVSGVICKVVLPYTDEASVLSEIARVLKPGAVAHLCGHGAGYYLRYVFCGSDYRIAIYGLRALINTWVYAIVGRHLPSFIGDTVYQSRQRLARYYRRANLRLVVDAESPTFLGFPVFIYQTVQKLER
jgi:ubiquinone/menaquinone biosynthesis C-methylase UbiE